MKFRCERDRLVEALQTASRAVSARASLPVLSGVRLELDDELRVTGSDLDLTISTAVDVDTTSKGVAVLNAKLVTEIVRALRPGSVTVDIGEDEASISAERSEFSVRTIPAAEYPKLSEPEGETATVDAATFAAAVRQVVSAASQDEARPILRGVQMEAEPEGVRLVATDSYRLAVRDLPGSSFLAEGQSVLVPRTALTELLRLAADADEITLRLGEREAAFDVGRSRLVTRLIEGQFPNYRSLIPSQHPNSLSVSAEELIDAVKRVKVVARDSSTPVKLSMTPDQLELSAATQDYGTAHEQLSASFSGDVTLAGQPFVIAFNPDYLIAGVEAAEAAQVVIELIDQHKPALLVAPEVPEYRYVLMPVRSP